MLRSATDCRLSSARGRGKLSANTVRCTYQLASHGSCRHFAWFVLVLCSLALSLSPVSAAEFFNDWATNNLSSVPS